MSKPTEEVKDTRTPAEQAADEKKWKALYEKEPQPENDVTKLKTTGAMPPEENLTFH